MFGHSKQNEEKWSNIKTETRVIVGPKKGPAGPTKELGTKRDKSVTINSSSMLFGVRGD